MSRLGNSRCKLRETISILDARTGKGGASPRSGGRDGRPPTLSGPSKALPNDKSLRWVPPSCSSVKREAESTEEKNDRVFRKVRGILNKLTPEKFDKLSLELLNVGIDSQVILKGIILLIFDKALDEPKYSTLYAQLCHRLCEDAPNFESSNITSFRRLLLNKCQDEFENRSRATEAFDRQDVPLTDEELEQYHLAKKKMLGNIKFIGELGKLQMLHEGILHKCIKQLLEKKKNTQLRDTAEDLECLCQIMRTVGPRLDTVRAKAWMNQYFERIKRLTCNTELPARIRFMLQDVVDLRDNKWEDRRVAFDHRPKTLLEIRTEAADETGMYIPSPVGGRDRALMNRMNGLGPHWRGGAGPGGSGLGDLFGPPPVGTMVNSIGTGPGVIQVDSFASQFPPSMGRNNRNNVPNQGYQNNFNRRPEGGSPRNNRHGNLQNQNHQNQQPLTSQSGPHFKQGGRGRGGDGGEGGGGGTRDLPPRFVRMGQQQQQQDNKGGGGALGGQGTGSGGQEEVSLRPVKNFILKPNVPNKLPKSAQLGNPVAPPTAFPPRNGTSPEPPIPTNPIMAKQPQITIKQANPDKAKSNKKANFSKEELKKTVDTILNDYIQNNDNNDSVNAIRELSIRKRHVPELVSQLLLGCIEKSESDRENVIKLMATLKSEGLLSPDQFMEGFDVVMGKMSELEEELPLVRSHVARLAAWAVSEGVISFSDLAAPMEGGVRYPLFLLCLQQMHKVRDKQWLVRIFEESKINLQNMLPECDRRKERMLEILEDRGLSFMFPLLRIQSELWKQIQAEPNATAIFKWVKEKVDEDMQKNPGFIRVLTTSILRYVAEESTLVVGGDNSVAPDKSLQEKEKELLDKMKAVLQMFVHNHMNLQLVALYSAQVYCYNNKFPKGMLLRFFMYFYDLEVVEEDAFLRWKEEVNDEYPGKGEALFQVNQWLTWLEQAEEESEEEEDDE